MTIEKYEQDDGPISEATLQQIRELNPLINSAECEYQLTDVLFKDVPKSEFTPEQLFKLIILDIALGTEWGEFKDSEFRKLKLKINLDPADLAVITSEETDTLFELLTEEEYDLAYEIKCDIRQGEVDTDIVAPYSRHYESKSVGYQAPNGQWIGWTYWYGGGKHGCPEEIDWSDSIYHLTVTEEQKLVTVRTFSKTV